MSANTIFLHGLGQSPADWTSVVRQCAIAKYNCPNLFQLTDGPPTYPSLLAGLEHLYGETQEKINLCGISLGAILAMNYALRHGSQVDTLVLIGTQYKIPTRMIDFQNFLFNCMPSSAFQPMGLSKKEVKLLTYSMRKLDFTSSLHKLTCRVIIVCGARDFANLNASKKLKALLPHAQLHIVPKVGHEVNKMAPDFISEILKDMVQ